MPLSACGNKTKAGAGKRGVHWGISALVKTFVSPQTSLGDLDAGSAASLIAASSDVTLIVDAQGTIRDTAFQSMELLGDLSESADWVGRALATTVAPDSRPKVEALLREAATTAEPKWRHVNHITPEGRSVPVLYCGVQIGGDGRIVLFGRDLRVMSALQQRLMNAQQSMERDYSKLRDVEMRYRLLFQLSSEAVLILDSVKGRVLEANAAAQDLFGAGSEDVVGRAMADIFGPDSLPALQGHLAAIRAGAKPEDTPARLAQGGQPVSVKVSLFRQENAAMLLMRISPVQSAVPVASDVKAKLLRAVESAPDGFVVTDHHGAVITANAAFLEMAQLLDEHQARGQPLDRWVGASGVDLDVLTANLRDRGSVRFFTTTMRGEAGSVAQVEISAVAVRNGGQPSFGYAIRNVGPRLHTDTRAARQLPRSVEQLTELIGRVALKDLVREATEVIERLSIEAALELTNDNRASAAEMLGLSRQSLYVKLRRYGLGDLSAAEPS